MSMDERHRQSSRMGMKSTVISLLSALLVLLIVPVSATIPYTPSYIFLSSQHNDSLAYLLLSNSSTQNKTTFLSLNISGNVDAANPSYSVLLDEVPFQTDSRNASVPVIDQDGIIKAYTGDCQGPASKGAIWQFSPESGSSIGNGTWIRWSLEKGNGDGNTNPHGPFYLAAGFSYAASNSTPSSIYTFGGMCPFHNGSSQDWVSAANYSQSMLVLDPSGSSSSRSYALRTTGNRAPPIPEAGFTMTSLPATYATTSSGSKAQQQSFLLIGGHTRNAFINMSELALFSIPQNSWSFVTVDSQSTSAKTELAMRNEVAVEPRSGHSAVLSPDCTKVVIFGGWVGDTRVAAHPQLAVLELGAEYGGSGQWAWKTPSTEGSGLKQGTGIFGHGATILPGGVMMVAGGYSIPASSSKRSVSQLEPNSQVYFYNLTSNQWTTSYTNPDQQAAGTSDSGSGLFSSPSKKAGLGVGLGVGVTAVAGIAVFIWFYARKRRARQRRDQELRQLALGAERSHFWDKPNMSSSLRSPMQQVRNSGNWGQQSDNSYPWAGNRGNRSNAGWRDNGETVAEKTSLLVDIPSPTKSIRQSLSSRPYRFSYYSEFRKSNAPGDIHPIDEREEDEANAAEDLMAPGRQKDQQGYSICETTDPFEDPASIVAESSVLAGVASTAQAWLDQSDRASATRSRDGRPSTDEGDRTSSNLSDSSSSSFTVRSAVAVILDQSRVPVLSRPSSNLTSSGRQSPEKSASLSTHSGDPARSTPDSAMVPAKTHYSADSFSTAHTSVSQMQAEAEHLLKGAPEWATSPESPTKATASARPKASEWIGTVRRALTGSRKGSSANRNSATTAVTSGIDRSSTIVGSKSSGNVGNGAGVPRRAVSASAELFRRKQGAKDWGADRQALGKAGPSMRGPRSTRDDSALDGLYGLGDDEIEEEDWDVEAAAEGRRVQVTFTVPKEKLRVVNASATDMDNISELSISRMNSDTVGKRQVSQ